MDTPTAGRQFLNVRETANRYGVAVSSVWRWTRDGKIQPPVRLAPGCTRWNLDDLKTFENGLGEGHAS